MLSVKRISLVNSRGMAEALSNAVCYPRPQSEYEAVIYNTIAETKAHDKYQLSKEVGDALNASRAALGTNYTAWLPGLKGHENTNDLYLTYVDGCGNIYNLTIYLEGDFPECQIHDFYIGSDYGSGLQYDNIDDFFEALRAEIMKRSADGATTFDITIND